MATWKRDYQSYRLAVDENANPIRTKDAVGQQGGVASTWQQQMKARLRKLSEILDIPRILTELDGIEQLILIPHRDLHLLPLNYLFPERFTITYLPSTQIGIYLQQSKPKPIGAIDDLPLLNVEQLGSPPLIFAFIESAAISLLCPNHNRLRGTDATRE